MAFPDLVAAMDQACLAHLGGVPVTYRAGVGDPTVEVQGLFDAAFVLVEVGTGVASTAPVVFLRLAGLPTDPSQDRRATVTIADVRYRIVEPQPDGQGGVRCRLQQV